MNLTELNLRNFRNYEEISLEFDPGVNLIVGQNAQGKTNLLEAIGYLGSGKSFRAQKTGEMLRFGAEFADITGSVFSQERNQYLRWVLFPASRPRQLHWNGVKRKSASEIVSAPVNIASLASETRAESVLPVVVTSSRIRSLSVLRT